MRRACNGTLLVSAGTGKAGGTFYLSELINAWRKLILDKKLLDILVCPVTKGPLIYAKEKHELISLSARLAYPIRDDVPVMLEDEARTLTEEEAEQYRG